MRGESKETRPQKEALGSHRLRHWNPKLSQKGISVLETKSPKKGKQVASAMSTDSAAVLPPPARAVN